MFAAFYRSRLPTAGRKPVAVLRKAGIGAALIVILAIPARAETLILQVGRDARENPPFCEAVRISIDWAAIEKDAGIRFRSFSDGTSKINRPRFDPRTARQLLEKIDYSPRRYPLALYFHPSAERLAGIAGGLLKDAGISADFGPLNERVERRLQAEFRRSPARTCLIAEFEKAPDAPVARPDLTVDLLEPEFNPETAELTVRFRAFNRGGSAADAGRISIGDDRLGLRFPPIDIPGLPAREPYSAMRTFPVSRSYFGRRADLTAVIELTRGGTDSDPDNNRSKPRRISFNMPDLVISRVRPRIEDERLIAEVTIANGGGAGAVSTLLRMSDKSGQLNAEVRTPPLPGGGEETIELAAHVPERIIGQHIRLEVEIDPNGRVLELDERNNSRETALALEIESAEKLPDLAIDVSAVEFEPKSRRLAIDAVVYNQGNAEAEETDISLIYGSDSVLGLTDETSPRLRPDEHRNVVLTRQVQSGMIGRTVHLRARIDASSAIAEISEENNFSRATSVFFAKFEPPPPTIDWRWVAAAAALAALVLLVRRFRGRDPDRRGSAPHALIFRPRPDPGAQSIDRSAGKPGIVFDLSLRPVADSGSQTVTSEMRTRHDP